MVEAPKSQRKGPLVGVRVLDAGNIFAAPFAASLLGDMGADVLKIEMPGVGDGLRGFQPFDGDEGLLWTCLSRNKRSITLDMRQGEGRELFLRLVAEQDVMFENFRPGTLDRWGLDLQTLREVNPNLIVVRVSGFGQTGPNAMMPGFGTPAAAYSGYVYSTGFPDRPPVLPPINLVDYVAGTFAAFGAMVALYYRDQLGGQAEEVDVALYETVLRYLEGFIAQYDRLGTLAERQGNEVVASVPVGTFQAGDGVWMVLSTSTDRTFNRLAEVMGRSDMITDPRSCTNKARVENREYVKSVVTGWFAAHTGDEIQKALDEVGAPVSRVNSMADVFEDAHVAGRDSLVQVDHPQLGTMTMPAVVPRFSQTPGEVRTPGPSLGQHNDEVFSALGLSTDDIERLTEAGVI